MFSDRQVSLAGGDALLKVGVTRQDDINQSTVTPDSTDDKNSLPMKDSSNVSHTRLQPVRKWVLKAQTWAIVAILQARPRKH